MSSCILTRISDRFHIAREQMPRTDPGIDVTLFCRSLATTGHMCPLKRMNTCRIESSDKYTGLLEKDVDVVAC